MRQSYERLLFFASGGALELSKCFSCIIYRDVSDSHHMLEPSEIDGCVQGGDSWAGPSSLTYGDTSTLTTPSSS